MEINIYYLTRSDYSISKYIFYQSIDRAIVCFGLKCNACAYNRVTSTSNIMYVFLSFLFHDFNTSFFFLLCFIWFHLESCSMLTRCAWWTTDCSVNNVHVWNVRTVEAFEIVIYVWTYNCDSVVRNELWWECTSYLMNDNSFYEDTDTTRMNEACDEPTERR